MPADQLSFDEVFDAALQLPVSERASFVNEALGHEPAARERVKRLLLAHADAKSFLESPARDPLATKDIEPQIAECPGDVIGPYKLLQQIGEGGMGVVFMAEQAEPIERTVALKIIKPGMDSRQVIARFEAERQALAMMDHPNIAKVLDAGTTPTGRPYFVMELVKGVPITKYCDEKQLTVRDRLQLLLPVCQAVQHAHQKGIIHRDIKPTNVLVAEYDNQAVPKVIDFGVAKATSQKLTERTMFTEFGQVVGTVEYMSPEQAKFNQLDIDTRSDIYSLGVLIYELLTGSTPFERVRLHEAAFDEMLRIIREEEPQKPSTRLSTIDTLPSVAANRHTEPARLNKDIRGELDWIVMKCLEKDRNRRYESVSALASDVSYHLNDEPVTAGPPSQLYRFKKSIRRNKGPVIVATAVLLGLVTAAIGATVGLVSQSRQRAIAERERAEAQLNLAAAMALQTKHGDAERLYRRGLEYLRDGTPEDRRRAAQALLQLAAVVPSDNETERVYREALQAYRTSFPDGDPFVSQPLLFLGVYLRNERRYAEAEPLLEEAYRINRNAAPADHQAIGLSAVHLGSLFYLEGNLERAVPLLREAIAEYKLASPPSQYLISCAQFELGRALVAQENFRQAEVVFVDALKHVGTSSYCSAAMAMIGLYSNWDKAAPGKGYDVKAQQWNTNMLQEYYHPGSISVEAKAPP
jgi:serine/threonine protein kinase/tetratricopeptide (TPR) repeat protein